VIWIMISMDVLDAAKGLPRLFSYIGFGCMGGYDEERDCSCKCISYIFTQSLHLNVHMNIVCQL